MNFSVLDLEHWKRASYFEHYMHQVRCTFSMTSNIDITLLLGELRKQQIKLYPALIHMIAVVVNRHVAFRTCFNETGDLGYWDEMNPSYTIFHSDDQSFSSLWISFHSNFQLFYQQYLNDIQDYGRIKRLYAKVDEPPNTFPVSCIPWVPFSSFNLNVHNGGTFLRPIFTIGKYEQRDGRTLLPLALQLHHAVCDGYHAGVVYQEMQQLADEAKNWLKD